MLKLKIIQACKKTEMATKTTNRRVMAQWTVE